MTVSEFLIQAAQLLEGPEQIKKVNRQFLAHECRNYAVIALNLQPQEEKEESNETGDVAK